MIYTDEMDGIDRWMLEAWMEAIAHKHGVKEPFPSAMLPRTGLAARDENGSTLAVATLYLEKSSAVAVCGFCVADPLNRGAISAAAVKLLIAALPVYAKRRGAEFLMSVFGRKSLNKLLDNAGFVTGETAETKWRKL